MNYKEVDAQYLNDKMNEGDYQRRLIEKNGKVKARQLDIGDRVKIYYYNDTAQIETKEEVIKTPNRMLVTKTINGKEYNTIMGPLTFHKTYTKEFSLGVPVDAADVFVPVSDPLYAYEVNENIVFTNMYEQTTKLCPGDLIVPYDAAHNNFYGIYQYNFQDNYRFIDEQKHENKQALKV